MCVTAQELDLPFLSVILTLSKFYSRTASDLLKMCGEKHPEDYMPTLPINHITELVGDNLSSFMGHISAY